MIEIGIKKLNGEPLTNAERLYRHKTRKKLKPDNSAGRISEDEKQKIIELNRRGQSSSEIVRVTGRSAFSVKGVLREAGLTSAYPAQAARVREEKKELIKQAYFVEGKSISQIAIETHTWRKTVREVVRAGKEAVATTV